MVDDDEQASEWEVQNDKKLEILVDSYKLRLLVFVGNYDFTVTHW